MTIVAFVRIETRKPPLRIEDRLQTGTPETLEIDVHALEADIRRQVEGEVRFRPRTEACMLRTLRIIA